MEILKIQELKSDMKCVFFFDGRIAKQKYIIMFKTFEEKPNKFITLIHTSTFIFVLNPQINNTWVFCMRSKNIIRYVYTKLRVNIIR